MVSSKATLKRVAKLLISIGVRTVDVIGAAYLTMIGASPGGRCVILYYHAVTESQRERFRRQMDEVQRLTEIVRADHSEELEHGKHHSAITFDDGFLSVVENALPLLEELGIPCTIFVPSGSLGQHPIWIHDPSHPAASETVMNAQQLRELNGNPLVTIGSHSISHPDFRSLSPGEARKQFEESKVTLEAILDVPVRTFSFPHGACNPSLVEMARIIGYRRVFTIEPERPKSLSNRLTCGRMLSDPDDWPLEFRLKVLGAYRWMAWSSPFASLRRGEECL